jgi:hypothetical protein
MQTNGDFKISYSTRILTEDLLKISEWKQSHESYTKIHKDDYKVMPLGNYSVWVGGCEEHSHLTYQHAVAIKNEYIEDGYDDVEIDILRGGLKMNMKGLRAWHD